MEMIFKSVTCSSSFYSSARGGKCVITFFLVFMSLTILITRFPVARCLHFIMSRLVFMISKTSRNQIQFQSINGIAFLRRIYSIGVGPFEFQIKLKKRNVLSDSAQIAFQDKVWLTNCCSECSEPIILRDCLNLIIFVKRAKASD